MIFPLAEVISNQSSVIEQENGIGNYIYLSPHATLYGMVNVKQLTHIGANATVIQGIAAGEQVMVGAGSTVIQDTPNQVTVVGSPAKIREKVKEEVGE